MSSLNIEYNGKTIPIANVGIVSSKEKVILGNLERDLLLQTLGSVQIQVGNKFYELPFNTDGSWSGGNLNIKDIDGLDNLDLSSYSNGTFLYDTKGNVLYLIHNKTLITISGSDDDNQIFLSYINEQKLSGQQKYRLILNAGQFLSSLQDVKLFTVDDVYDGMIVFVNDEKTHYILSNSRYPNEISSWETFYIGNQGGLIKNGLTIKNQSRENLLYLNEIDAMQNGIFNGLKIGSDEKWMKSSVNILDQSLINYNTKEFLIKNQSYKIFHVLNNNIGIRGDASGSDDYNIIAHGSLKMNGPFFTDKKMVSTDFNTINITHWDGGRGFGLTRGSDSKWNLEIDNLIVRDSLVANKMVLKSLEVERAYATGGHILVTDGAVINSYNYRKPTAEELQTANVTYNGNHGTLEANSYYYFVTFKESTEKDDNDAYVSLPTTPALPSENNLTDNIEKDTLDVDKNCPFIAGDVLLCQTASGLTAKRYYAYVSYSTNKYIAIKSNHLRNNVIYQRDNEGNPVSIFKDFSIEANDSLIRITNLLTDNEGVYKNKNRRRFIDIDGTRNQITMYDNLGNPNLFSGAPNADGFYDDIEIITGIGQNGSLRLRMGELSDLGINGITGYGLYCDNVLLKGKLIVKDPSGEYPIGATKGAWIHGNTNTYYLNDIISYNGSAYRCIVQHTNTAQLQAMPGVSDFWEIFVEKGSDGTVGQDFTSVEVIGEQIFIYDKTSQAYDKSYISLTATLKGIKPENVTEAKFQWKINNTVIYETVYNDEQITENRIVNSANIYPSGSHEGKDWSAIWQSNKQLSIYCYVYLNQSITESYFDVISISKLSDGVDGTDGIDGIDGSNSISAFLTNDSHLIPTDANGNNPNFSGASSRIYIYNGGIDDTANWNITFVESGVSGTKSGSTYTVTGISVDSGYVDFVANREGYSQITKRFDIKKSKTGADGVSYYTWIRYADTLVGGGISNDPTGKLYIGFAYNKTTATESNTPSDYTWSLIKGEKGDQGVQGATGVNGITYYTWIKYSDNSDGTGLYDTPTSNTQYIGIAVNKTTPTESTVKTDYTWSKFKGEKGDQGIQGLQGIQGEKGDQGIPGVNGANGETTYFHVKYSNYADGSNMNDTGGLYIGTYVDFTATDSIDKTKYKWVLIKGVQGDKGDHGIPGVNGSNGLTSYLHIKYSNDGGVTFTTNNGEDTGAYIGQYTDFVQLDSSDPTKYTWSKIVGEKGDTGAQGVAGADGADGVSPTVYEIVPDFYTWNKSDYDIVTPNKITFNFYQTVGTSRTAFNGYFDMEYSTDGTNFISYGAGQGTYISFNLELTHKAIRCNLYSNSNRTIKVDYQTAIMVRDGKDSYTIVLSNEAFTVPCQADGSFVSGIFLSPYKYYTDINVYRGTTKLPLSNTSGWSMEFPSGGLVTMAPTQIDSYTWRANVTGFTGDSTVMSGEGLIKINIYTGVYNVATYSFNKSLSLSKAQQGPLLDWIKEWDGASTYVDTYKVISPKMFAGSKNGSTYTGVAMGRDVFGLGSNGIAGFYNSTKTFHIDAATGNCIFGNGDNSISYVANTGQINFGKNVALNWNSSQFNLIGSNIYTGTYKKAGYKFTDGLQLQPQPSLNRINLITNPIKQAGWYSVSFWGKLEGLSTSFYLNVNINDNVVFQSLEGGTHGWNFYSGSVYVTSYVNSYGFIDFEGITSGSTFIISDLIVVEGKNIPQTYSPPMTLINSDGIYTGNLNADQITAGQIGAARLVINETLNVGGNSSAGSYNGVISVKNDSNTEVVRLDRTGLIALAGKIAGFTISGEALTNTGFANDAALIFRNDAAGVFSGIGGSILPATTATRCLLYLQNHESTGSYGANNYGAFISVKNSGGKNIALKAIGAIQASTVMSDKIAYWVMGSTNTWVPSIQDTIMITAYQNYSLVLPTKAIIASQFDYSTLPNDFGFTFTLHCRHNCSYTITVEPPSGVNLYNQNGDTSTFNMTKGDSATLLCTNEGGFFRYETLSRFN